MWLGSYSNSLIFNWFILMWLTYYQLLVTSIDTDSHMIRCYVAIRNLLLNTGAVTGRPCICGQVWCSTTPINLAYGRNASLFGQSLGTIFEKHRSLLQTFVTRINEGNWIFVKDNIKTIMGLTQPQEGILFHCEIAQDKNMYSAQLKLNL